MNKTQRLKDIVQIVGKKSFNSQNELLDVLLIKGYKITQATLSRDLKYLKTSKERQENGKYKYVLPNSNNSIKINNTNVLRGFISIKFSLNIAVIKTVSAFANSIAYAIEEAKFEDILGTIAGDDTIIIVLNKDTNIKKFNKKLIEKFPELRNKI